MLKSSILEIFLIMFIINFNQVCNCQTHKEELEDTPNKSSKLLSDDTLIISEKNPAIAFGCSLIIPGLGQMYNEDVGQGFIYFSGATVGAILALASSDGDPAKTIGIGVSCIFYLISIIEAPIRANNITKESRIKKQRKNIYSQIFEYESDNYNITMNPTMNKYGWGCSVQVKF
jgi:TM2 domain-containing membrane protein YozV